MVYSLHLFTAHGRHLLDPGIKLGRSIITGAITGLDASQGIRRGSFRTLGFVGIAEFFPGNDFDDVDPDGAFGDGGDFSDDGNADAFTDNEAV